MSMNTRNINFTIKYESRYNDLHNKIEEISFDALKSNLTKLIADIIHKSDWNQNYAAKILGIDQPKISQIKNLKFNGFSLEKLMKFVIVLNYEISISVKTPNNAISKG